MDLENKRLYHWLPWAVALAVVGLFILLLRNDLLRQEDAWQQHLLLQQKNTRLALQARQNQLEQQSMLLAKLIASDKDVVQLIRRAHQIFETNPDAVLPDIALRERKELNERLEYYWRAMNLVRGSVLNVYFSPGATVFLRVNKSERFGDDVSAICPLVIETLHHGKPNSGMEVCRYGSAYRSLVPIFATEQQTEGAAIAAIEVGLSLLPSVGVPEGKGEAVLLHPSVVNDLLWGSARSDVQANTGAGRGKWGLEDFTRPLVKDWQLKSLIPDVMSYVSQPWILHDQNKDYALIFTPVADFRSRNTTAAAPKVMILNWVDITTELASHEAELTQLKWKYLMEWTLAELLLWILLYFNRRYVLQVFRAYSQRLQQERDRSEQSRHRLTLALSSSESGFWEWNIATNKANFSREWRELCGLHLDDEDGTTDIEEWLSRVHPADKRASYTEMIRHIKGETPMFEHEYRLQIADGSYKWIFTRGKVVEWQEDKRAALMLGVYTDVTERKKNEIIVIRQQAALRALNEIASLPVVDAEDQLCRALAVGGRYFGLAQGRISCIQGNQYEVKVQVPAAKPGSDNKAGALADYFCEETYRMQDVFALDGIEKTDYLQAIHEKNTVESYIGVPVWLSGKIYGTLSFYSDHSRHQPFDDLDKDFMRLFSRWVGATLERWQYQFEQKVLLDRFAKITESLPGFLYQYHMCIDGSSYFPYCSSGIKDIYGVKPEDVISSATKVFDVIHPEDLGWISESVSTSATNLTIWSATYRVLHPSRGEIWVRGEARPERLPDGSTLWHGFIHDVTEEKRAAIKLQETNTLREAIFDAASISIISTDKNGLIKTFNRGAETMLGYSASEVINILTPGIFHLDEEVVAHTEKLNRELGWGIEPGFETLTAKAREGNEDENEWTYVRKNGTQLPVVVTASALRDPEGDITGYLGLARDISELKRIDKMKSEFISTVSHELRTPLTAISGSLGIIMGGAAGILPDTATKMINIAHKNSLRLIHLVNDLLDMEKLVAGKMHFDMQPQHIVPILLNSMEANAAYAQQFNVRFELKNLLYMDEKIMVDSQRIQQVLANFLSNAVKFSPPGEVVLITVEKNYNYVRVSVTDKGPGIPVDFRQRIFQKFSQADSSDSRQKGGTGLGLAICKEIIERMGGKIGFESVVGQGSEFYFEVPGENIISHHFERQDNKKPTGNRILVVEDDPQIADVLAIILRNANFRVDIAGNGQTAFERIALYSYQLITVDLNLPDMDGLQLIRQLRSDASTQDVPIIVISANVDHALLQVRNDAVFSTIEWMEKPIDENQLINTVKAMLIKYVKTEVSL